MAALDTTRVLSTPKVLVDGRIIKHMPNSVSMELGGEMKVRAVSSGGGAVSIVAGLNAEELLSTVKFEVAATAEMVEWVRETKDKTNRGQPVTVRLVEDTAQFAFVDMYFANKSEIGFEAEGKISVELMGLYVP